MNLKRKPVASGPPPDRPLPLVDARLRLIRFEDPWGDGLFRVAGDFERYFEMRSIRLNRGALRAVLDLKSELWNCTPGAHSAAYDDARSRSPITWFRADATDQLRIAERLVRLLNRHGADIRRVETDRPPPILWQDAVQVVTRRPRRPAVKKLPPVQSRQIDRRKKLERVRARSGRARARRAKSGL